MGVQKGVRLKQFKTFATSANWLLSTIILSSLLSLITIKHLKLFAWKNVDVNWDTHVRKKEIPDSKEILAFLFFKKTDTAQIIKRSRNI